MTGRKYEGKAHNQTAITAESKPPLCRGFKSHDFAEKAYNTGLFRLFPKSNVLIYSRDPLGDLSKAIVELAKTNTCSTDINIKIAPLERGNPSDATERIDKFYEYKKIIIKY